MEFIMKDLNQYKYKKNLQNMQRLFLNKNDKRLNNKNKVSEQIK